MKGSVLFVITMLAVSTSAFAQGSEGNFDRALAAAPRQARQGATSSSGIRLHVRDLEEGHQPGRLLRPVRPADGAAVLVAVHQHSQP